MNGGLCGAQKRAQKHPSRRKPRQRCIFLTELKSSLRRLPVILHKYVKVRAKVYGLGTLAEILNMSIWKEMKNETETL